MREREGARERKKGNIHQRVVCVCVCVLLYQTYNVVLNHYVHIYTSCQVTFYMACTHIMELHCYALYYRSLRYFKIRSISHDITLVWFPGVCVM